MEKKTVSDQVPQADFTEGEVVGSVARGAAVAKTLLITGSPGRGFDSKVDLLRVNGYHVVTAVSPAEATESLRSGQYLFQDVLFVGQKGGWPSLEFVAAVRRQQPKARLILQTDEENKNDMPPNVVDRMDMLIESNGSHSNILDKLAKDI